MLIASTTLKQPFLYFDLYFFKESCSVVLPFFQVLNLTRYYIQRHQNFVVPLIEKYSKEWLSRGDPIFRPTWWLSPTEPAAFTIDDQFLIGEEVRHGFFSSIF